MPHKPSHIRRYTRPPKISGSGKILFSEKRISIETLDGTLYYVFSPRASGYVHGDIVEYGITREAADGKLPEARPLRLVKRSQEDLLMRMTRSHGKVTSHILEGLGGMKVICESIPREFQDGDLFVVRFVGMGIVRVIRFFGSEWDPGILAEIIFFRSGVRTVWPESFAHLEMRPLPVLPRVTPQDIIKLPKDTLLRQSSIFPKLGITGHDRLDFRGWRTMTIDGVDAQDLDDAISIARYEDGDYLLAVHIADVAEYVEEGTELDREAYLRGTSIYTPGRVIPMLPEILSNDRCSLHPGSPKLTLSILMRVDSSGVVRDTYVTEWVIESERKWVYDEVWQELQDESGTNQGKSTLSDLSALYRILERRRAGEGKILFETTECYFDLDTEGVVTDIRRRERNDAHMMIEEFMVLANEEIAKWAHAKKIPFLSRVHDAPSSEKDREIREIIAMRNTDGKYTPGSISLRAIEGEITPRHIREILEASRETGDLYRLSRLLLPKMAKAVYREKALGHFGLALGYYAHFTSPIRRYPDLLLHRMIKKYLHGSLARDRSSYEKQMKKWGLSLSEKERSAEEVSRAVNDLRMCEYMRDKVGESFDGIISGLTESNIYIELENGVEGSIYLGGSKTPPKNVGSGVLTLDPIRGALLDTKGWIIWQIGQSIRIEIREVDMKNRRIEMGYAD